MVATREAAVTTASLSTADRSSQFVTMTQWAPRTGRTKAYDEWEHSLHQICIVMHISYKALPLPPPTLESVADRVIATRKAVKQEQELEAEFLLAYQEWLDLNTTMYNIVFKSLVLDGPWHEVDLQAVRAYMGDMSSDGFGLIAWARAHADLKSTGSQNKLRANIYSMELKAGSSQVALQRFTQLMWDMYMWQQVEGNVASAPLTYWEQLLLSLPQQPESSHLVTTRTWLVGKIEEFQAGSEAGLAFKDVGEGLKRLLDHAKLIGLPVGTVADARTVDSSLRHAGIFGLGLPSSGGSHQSFICWRSEHSLSRITTAPSARTLPANRSSKVAQRSASAAGIRDLMSASSVEARRLIVLLLAPITRRTSRHVHSKASS